MHLDFYSAGLLLGLGLCVADAAADSGGIFTVKGRRVELGEILTGLVGPERAIDLCKAPPPGGRLTISRAQIRRRIRQAGFAAKDLKLPRLAHLRAEGQKLTPAAVSQLVRPAIEQALPSGVRLLRIDNSKQLTVSPEVEVGAVRLGALPKRVGTVKIAISVALLHDKLVSHQLPVAVVLQIDEEGAAYAASRGSSVTLTLQRKTARITVEGTLLGNADLGDVALFRVNKTGRVLRARLVSKSSAVVVNL